MRLTAFCLVCIIVFCIPTIATGQIFRTTPDTVLKTAYSDIDSIHIFNSKTSKEILGSLQVISPVGPANFEWSKYETLTRTWVVQAGESKTNVNSFTFTNLPSGGYKVRITATGFEQEYIAWVFSRNVFLDKESTGEVKYLRSKCTELDLSVLPVSLRLIYYNPVTKAPLELRNWIRYQWNSDGGKDKDSVERYVTDTTQNVRYRKERLPLDTTWFFVKVTDSYKLGIRDSVKYPPIISKADFDTLNVKYLTPENELSAPVQISFRNKSINAVSYIWKFQEGDTLPTNDTALIKKDFVESNKKYKVILTATSDRGCIDTISKSFTVAPAQIGVAGDYDLPNVFTPNNDNVNDYFIFNAVSVQYFNLTIYSRWGKVTYQKQGDGNEILSGKWKGWDGKLKSGANASPGLYYYVLEVGRNEPLPPKPSAEGKERFHSDGIYKGFFYLFR